MILHPCLIGVQSVANEMVSFYPSELRKQTGFGIG
jgi:hypothetical protein